MKKCIVVIVIFLVLIGGFFFRTKFLILEEDKTGYVIWKKEVDDGSKFAIEYLHSVEKTPVWEYFKIKDKKIILTGTRYESYGAGLPFLNKHEYIVANDKFEIRNINKELDDIPLRVSDFAKHKLLFKEKEYKLYQLTEAKNLVLIKVEKQSFLERLLRRWIR